MCGILADPVAIITPLPPSCCPGFMVQRTHTVTECGVAYGHPFLRGDVACALRLMPIHQHQYVMQHGCPVLHAVLVLEYRHVCSMAAANLPAAVGSKWAAMPVILLKSAWHRQG